MPSMILSLIAKLIFISHKCKNKKPLVELQGALIYKPNLPEQIEIALKVVFFPVDSCTF